MSTDRDEVKAAIHRNLTVVKNAHPDGDTAVVMIVVDQILDALDAAEEENAELREQMRTMHPSVVHDCCVAVAQVRQLADTIESEIAPFMGGHATVVDRIRGALVVAPVDAPLSGREKLDSINDDDELSWLPRSERARWREEHPS